MQEIIEPRERADSSAKNSGRKKPRKFAVVIGLIGIACVWTPIHFLAELARGNWWSMVPLVGIGLVTYYAVRVLTKVALFLVENEGILSLGTNVVINLMTFFSVLIQKKDSRSQEWARLFILEPEEFNEEMRKR